MKINGMTDWRLRRMFEGDDEGAGANSEGQSDAGTGGDGVGAPPSAGEGEPVKADTALAKKSADADDKSGDGEGDADGEGAEGKTDDKADAKSDDKSGAASDVAIAPPEGMEAFAEDYGTYSEFVDGLMTEKPDMSVKEALLEAANWQAGRVQAALDGAEGQAIEALEAQVETWTTEGKKDNEFGGDKYDENVAQAIRGLEQVAGQEVKDILMQTGLGSHPEVIRMFMKIGQVFDDPSIVTSKGGIQSKKSDLEILYPKKP